MVESGHGRGLASFDGCTLRASDVLLIELFLFLESWRHSNLVTLIERERSAARMSVPKSVSRRLFAEARGVWPLRWYASGEAFNYPQIGRFAGDSAFTKNLN